VSNYLHFPDFQRMHYAISNPTQLRLNFSFLLTSKIKQQASYKSYPWSYTLHNWTEAPWHTKPTKLPPEQFLAYILVGLTGTISHLTTLAIGYQIPNTPFITSQTVATYTTMTSNYFINNQITFKTSRHKGKKIISGPLNFYVVCSIAALISISFAQFIYFTQLHWVIAGFAGGVSASSFNYTLSSLFTWKVNKP